MVPAAVKKILLVVPLVLASTAWAQAPIATITLSPDQIGKVKTAQGISTRITFPEPVYEVICGDLYDTNTGKGLFVVQRSGDDQNPGTAVYLKPVAARGVSNLFVTTGEKGKFTYNFDLEIVPIAQAHRVVNVVSAPPANPSTAAAVSPGTPPNGVQGTVDGARPVNDSDPRNSELEQQARRQADEILRNARQQADRVVAEAEARVIEADRQSVQRGGQEAERRFVQALLLGLREVRIEKPRAAVGKVTLLLDPRLLILDDKCYVRYTIQNTGDKEFVFGTLAVEKITGKESQPITVEVNQSKQENKLDPGEVLAGVLVFEHKAIATRERVVLFVRGEDNSEIIRVNIQQ